jgi:hypothetical protein
VPLWAREAGFDLLSGGAGDGSEQPAEDVPAEKDGLAAVVGENMCVRQDLAVCVDEELATVQERLEAELCRALIRNQYPSVKKWFWEVEDCVAECLERNTRFQFLTIFGCKS